MKSLRTKNIVFIAIILSLTLFSLNLVVVQGETLESTNYQIIDSNINSGGGVSDGNSGYDLLTAAGQAGADTRLESTNYTARTGFPNGIQANVPIINCFETTTNSGSTSCSFLPNSNGMEGECGQTGCYDRAKIEIDPQSNPIDTLYLVAISKDNFTTTLYLQSDHTISSTFDINDYMTLCGLQGRDDRDANCDDASDANWDTTLQSYNIYSLESNTTYEVMVRAVSGDFTETQFSTTSSATTSVPSISFDVDVATTDTETAPTHSIQFGQISTTVQTADKSIWLDIGTNSINGINVYVSNLGQGLYSSANSTGIPSESEDLSLSDGDGGYGLKNISVTQSSLGPLQQTATYNTAGAEEVGGMSSTNTLIFYTDSTGSNLGQLLDGRSRTNVKVKSYSTLPSGDYSDTITFNVFSN